MLNTVFDDTIQMQTQAFFTHKNVVPLPTSNESDITLV